MKIIHGISQIVDNYKCLILDAWGVLHNGRIPFKHVITTLNHLILSGKKIIILTNSPSRISKISMQLELIGIKNNLYDEIISSGEIAFEGIKRMVKHNIIKNKCFYVGQEKHKHILDELGMEMQNDLSLDSFILNSGPYCQTDFLEKYYVFFNKAINLGVVMICINPDKFVVKDNKFAICAGSLAKEYEKMGGIVYYYGKPYSHVYSIIKKKISCAIDEALIVGDSIDTDIKGGKSAGFDTMMVMSGVFGMMHGYSEGFSVDTFKSLPFCPNYVLKEFMW